jgi:hypothetical protein
MSHEKCHLEICQLKMQLDRVSKEKDAAEEKYTNQCRNAEIREKSLQEKIISMQPSSRTISKEKDKTVEGLIELIEKDTQELAVHKTNFLMRFIEFAPSFDCRCPA